MKKTLILIFAALFALALCGCGAEPVPTEPATQAPTAAPTEAPTPPPTETPTEPATEAPTEPLPTNPLTGETVAEPMTGRFFCVSINNVEPALPHRGVVNADLYFEMFVNDYATRGLAVYADIENAGSIGSIRSLRYNFTDLAQGYDAIVVHAGGSDTVMSDLRASRVPNVNGNNMDGFYRDSGRKAAGYATEHTLFAHGADLLEEAADRGYRVTLDEEKDFGLRFAPDGTPADGEAAGTVTINFIHKGREKQTKMIYDGSGYVYNQYGMEMKDDATGEKEVFENVIVVLATVTNQGVYHVAALEGEGSGFYACGGKLIPITWSRSGPYAPFTFALTDGSRLQMGAGSSYIAIAPTTSQVRWS